MPAPTTQRMTRTEIEATEWARRFKTECWTSYAEAVALAEAVDRVVIEKRDDHRARGDYEWAIIPADNEADFWLDALPTKKAALAVCREMKWRVVR